MATNGEHVSDGLRYTTPKPAKALGFETVADLSSAVALTPPAGTRYAIIQVAGEDVRFRDDGTSPDASTGILLSVGDILEAHIPDFSVLEFIETTSSATLNVSYYS